MTFRAYTYQQTTICNVKMSWSDGVLGRELSNTTFVCCNPTSLFGVVAASPSACACKYLCASHCQDHHGCSALCSYGSSQGSDAF